jgi:hypothetical protein
VRAGDGEAARHTLRAAFNAMDSEWLSRHGHKVQGKGDGKARVKTPSLLGKSAPKTTAAKKKAR